VWIADVGQDSWEEIDMVSIDTPTPNFGWNKREGTHAYDDGEKPSGAIDPVFEYHHGTDKGEGCSITGGVVEPDGSYLFSDYCNGAMRRLRADGTTEQIGVKLDSVAGFGTDAAGRVYVASRGKGVYRLSGV
jgi:hypothetical protein